MVSDSRPTATTKVAAAAAEQAVADDDIYMVACMALSTEIRALRTQIDADAPTPPTDDPPPIPDTVDDAEAPATVPPPDDTDAQDPSPFTGAPGTGFDGTASTAQAQNRPKFNQRVYAYIESLPRGEKTNATKALRHYIYRSQYQPDVALEKYKERRVRDAQAPVGSTDFDELDASDSDAEESDSDTVTVQPRRRRGPMSQFFSSDTLPARTTAPTPDPPPFGSRVDDYFDNLGGSGPTMSKPALPEALSREDADAEIDDLRRQYAIHEKYARGGLLQRAQDLAFDAKHGLETDPNEDPLGDAKLAAWERRYGYPITLRPGYTSVANVHRDHGEAYDRETDEYRKARWSPL